MIRSTYVNVFEYITACESEAEYFPDVKVCRVLGFAENLDEVGDPDDLTDEYVELPDGTRLREQDGVLFDWTQLKIELQKAT